MSCNIVYHSEEIAEFYASHRTTWAELYPSERWILEHIGRAGKGFGHVLDIGCAVGGLGRALAEYAEITSYTGIDINRQAILAARTVGPLSMPTEFIEGDVLSCAQLDGREFQTVTCLNVADWNVESDQIIMRAWSHTAIGGTLVISLRLTPDEECRDFNQSYQLIAFGDDVPDDAERAPYAVFNTEGAIGALSRLTPIPDSVTAYGYWGAPSMTARTPFERLVFAVFAVRRSAEGAPVSESVSFDLHLPKDAFTGIIPPSR